MGFLGCRPICVLEGASIGDTPEIPRVLAERQPNALFSRDHIRAGPKFGPQRTVGWGAHCSVWPLAPSVLKMGCPQVLTFPLLGLLSPWACRARGHGCPVLDPLHRVDHPMTPVNTQVP